MPSTARRALALAADRHPAPWYRIAPQAAATTSDESAAAADVYVYDAIGGWMGVSADDFVREVAALDVDAITLHLNSPGGDVFDGVAIAAVLRAHRATVTVRVDGLAASAASVIAMAGDEVVMGIGSQMMVHDAWGLCVGNAAEMTKQAAALSSVSDSIASTYAARAGGTERSWRAIMQAETWYTATEAVAAGLADRVAARTETATATGQQVTPGAGSSFDSWWDTAASADRFDLSAFHYAGRAAAPPPPTPGARPAAATTQEDHVPSTLSDALRQRVGVTDPDADDETLLAALDEALAERTTETEPATPAEDESAEGEDEPAAAAQASAGQIYIDVVPRMPEGIVAIDAEQLAALRTTASAATSARAEQETSARAALVEAAVVDGRIPPARREHYAALHRADPAGTEALLAQLAPGTIPLGRPAGYTDPTGSGDELDTEPGDVKDTLTYQNWSI